MATRDELFYKSKNVLEQLDEAGKAACEAYAAGYMRYLDRAKTEREAVREAVALAEAAGFRAYRYGEALAPGDRVYTVNRGKALTLAVIGRQPMRAGINLAAAHVDSPRLDLKPMPLYEDSEVAYLKTHYYGGVKKYQWVTIPLALHGVVVRRDGTTLDVAIGEQADDPLLYITDLLPHLSADQRKKTMNEAITGESLNLIIGTAPDAEAGDERVKYAVLQLLHERYGLVEEDFLSAELTAVPAYRVREIGLDRSLIGGYGHDDRVCAYAELRALLDTEAPERTCVCLLVDKEEIGSEGVTGMQGHFFEHFIEALCQAEGTTVEQCFAASFCLSADVCNAFDPCYPEVSDKRNNAKLNHGVGIMKYTGSGGKSGSNDASAEVVGRVRQLFAQAGVIWQMGELGKVDQGGGGTVAKFTALRNIDTIDAGVPVLSMHAPYEVVAKADCYMTYKAMLALYQAR